MDNVMDIDNVTSRKINLPLLPDSTALLGNPQALRERWEQEGVLYLPGFLDPELISWAREKFRGALAAEGLIDLSVEAPVWTGAKPQTRNPCDALGTEVWHEFSKRPELNAVLRDIFDSEPVWIPIVEHRSNLPSGPIRQDQDLFAGRHQDGYFNGGILFATCWMPLRDVDQNSGSFAVAPGHHNRGYLYEENESTIRKDAVPDGDWLTADFRAGDLLLLHYYTPHTTLPNPSDTIRISLDMRAVPAWAPQPVIGAVQAVNGTEVTIRTEGDKDVLVHVSKDTFIRDMLPMPRLTLSELNKVAYPGAHVIAMPDADGVAAVLRRNWY